MSEKEILERAEKKTPLKWKFKTGSSVDSFPAVVDGVVYFGSDDNLYAVDIKTGEEKWKFKAGSSVSSSPAVVDGVVYFGSYDKHLYALDSKAGKEKWKFSTVIQGVSNGGSISSTPEITDGIVYFGSADKHLYALDLKTGKEKWKFETCKCLNTEDIKSSSVVDGVVYFGSMDNHLYALDSKTGEEKWRFETGDVIESSPAVVDGVVYFGSSDNYLYAVDIKNGEEKWKFETGSYVSSSPAVVDGVVYFGSSDNHLYAVDIKNGEEKWKFETGSYVSSSPAVVDGVVYFGSSDNYLYAVDCKIGKEKWKFSISIEWISSSPRVADGVVYFGSSDNYLYAVDIELAEKLSPSLKIKENELIKYGIKDEHIRTQYISGKKTLEEVLELHNQHLKEKDENDKKREIIIDLMNTSTIEDLEIIWENSWPLRWISPIFNDQYDFDSNPLELDKDYENSGTDESKMLSLQSEIIIKLDDDSYTLEDGVVWSESHVWAKEITSTTPGTLPIYRKKEIKGFDELLSELEGFGIVSLSPGAAVGINCKLDQDNLKDVISWDEWYGEVIKFDFNTRLVTVKDDETEDEYLVKLEDLFNI